MRVRYHPEGAGKAVGKRGEAVGNGGRPVGYGYEDRDAFSY